MDFDQATEALTKAQDELMHPLRSKWCPVSQLNCKTEFCTAFDLGTITSTGEGYVFSPPGCRNPLVTGFIRLT